MKKFKKRKANEKSYNCLKQTSKSVFGGFISAENKFGEMMAAITPNHQSQGTNRSEKCGCKCCSK
jgi:hypothetical protein